MAQKSILSIIQTAAAELNLPPPTAVVSSYNQNTLKMLALARAVCDDLLHEFDWQQLQKAHQLTTSDGVDSYDMPSDFERFINGTFFDQTNQWPLRGPKTPGEWQWLKAGLNNGAPFERFRVYNNKLWLTPVPGSTPLNLVFEYVSNAYVKDGTTGATKSDFTQDSDVCLFDHRLMVYGVKLKFLSSIGQDTSAALTDFNRAYEFAKGSDTPAPRLSLGPVDACPLISTANYPDGSWMT